MIAVTQFACVTAYNKLNEALITNWYHTEKEAQLIKATIQPPEKTIPQTENITLPSTDEIPLPTNEIPLPLTKDIPLPSTNDIPIPEEKSPEPTSVQIQAETTEKQISSSVWLETKSPEGYTYYWNTKTNGQ